MAPKFIKGYVKGNKNDWNDTEGICEAVGRANMCFVAVKTVEQQDLQALHRIRQATVKGRTALVNQMRGLLGEYGIVVPKGVGQMRRAMPALLEDSENLLSEMIRMHAVAGSSAWFRSEVKTGRPWSWQTEMRVSSAPC